MGFTELRNHRKRWVGPEQPPHPGLGTGASELPLRGRLGDHRGPGTTPAGSPGLSPHHWLQPPGLLSCLSCTNPTEHPAPHLRRQVRAWSWGAGTPRLPQASGPLGRVRHRLPCSPSLWAWAARGHDSPGLRRMNGGGGEAGAGHPAARGVGGRCRASRWCLDF